MDNPVNTKRTRSTRSTPPAPKRRRVRPKSDNTGSFLDDLKVWQKLALVTVVLILGAGAVAFASRTGLQVMRYHLYNIYEFMFVPITSINRADAYLTEVEANMAALVKSPLEEQSRIEAINNVKASGDEIITSYETEWLTTLSPEFTATLRDLGRLDLQKTEVTIFTALTAAYKRYNSLQDTYFTSVRNGSPNQEVGQNALAAIRTTLEQLNQLITVNNDFAALSYDTAVSAYRRSLITLLTSLGLIVGLGTLLAFIVTRSITNPIRKLLEVSQRVSEGDLSARANVSSTDELGVLAAAFNDSVKQLQVKAQSDAEILERNRELQANIGNFLNVAMDIASGDFTQRGQVSEDVLGNVVDAINLMVEEIGLVLTEFTDTANSVRSGSGEMLLTTEAIASGAQQQAVEAQRARNQVVQVTGSIQQMARDAEASARAAQQALTASEQGRKAVDDTLGGMQNIRREVQGISKRVKTLGERSLEISEIVETISRISSQTNLLALNAAIEAAGAGEAGQRFSVIADEVRKLAEDTSVATNRVDALIKRIQEEVQEVNLGVEGGTREVEAGYRVAAEAGERLKEVAAVVQQAVRFAQSISQATEAQVMSVTEVGSSVQSMATLSESSRDRVTQGREAAENLQELAERLTESLVRFRLA